MRESKKRGTIFFIVAVVLALITAFLLFVFLAGVERSAGEKVRAVVAKEEIPARTVIEESMVRLESIPRRYFQSSMFRNVESVVGLQVVVPIERREVLRRNVMAVPLNFDKEETAITIAVNDVTGVGGHISPGDLVNVLVSYTNEETEETKTIVLFQNKPVLAVGAMTNYDRGIMDEFMPEFGGQQTTSTVTLALTVEEATELTYMGNFAQEVRLTLRRKNSEPIGEGELREVTSQDFK